MASVDTFFPIQYQTSVDLAIQQMQSKLQNAVSRVDFQGERKAFNLMNKISSATAISSRKQATPDVDADLTKYWLTQTPYESVNIYDENDEFFLAQISLPTSESVMNIASVFNRTIDDVILAAARGTRYIGEDGTTSDALPSGQKVAVDYVESGSAVSSGLTIGKLRQAAYILDSNDVPTDERYLAIHAAQKRDLLRAAEIGDADYNTVRALVDGQVNTFMGFNIIWTNRVPLSTTRKVIAWHKNALKLSVGKKATYMDIRPDLRHSLQIRSVMNLGAVRAENEGVVEISCAE